MGKLNYRKDRHLDFLSKMDNESLDVLVNIITKDKDGKSRDSEDLTLQDRYKEYSPNHKEYWDLIAADYQYFGGNTGANAVRGEGVLYEEILTDTCKDMKVDFSKDASVETKEKELLLKVLENALDEMSDSEKKEFLKSVNYKSTDFTKQAIMGTLQGAIAAGGFASYQLAVVVANAIAKQLLGHGLSLATNAGLAKAIGIVSGPIGWAFTAIWTAVDLAGPAKRVTIPATIYIASLRQAELSRQAYEKEIEAEKQKEYERLKAVPLDLKNKWIIFSFIIFITSVVFYIYTSFSSTDKMNKNIRMFDKHQMVFQKVFFDKYLIYGNVFESRNEKRDKFTRQIIIYVSGTVEVSVNTDKLTLNKNTGKVTYYVDDKNSPFDVSIYIPEKNIKIVDNIYPKSIDMSDSVAIASVMGIAGAVIGASAFKKGIVPMGKLNNLQGMAIGGILGGTGGIAVGLNTKGMRLRNMFGVKQKDEIIVKAQDLITFSLKNDKKMVEKYRKNFSKIMMAQVERQGIKFSGVDYEEN